MKLWWKFTLFNVGFAIVVYLNDREIKAVDTQFNQMK